MLLLFFLVSLLMTFSIFGYGLFLTRIINLSHSDYNFGLLGFIGLFCLSIISSYTHIFFPHNYIHNLFLHSLGLILLIIFIKNDQIKFQKDLKFFLLIFSLLFIALLISKTNEDYPYYHLPNSLQFAQQKLQFGIGNLNHGFKHISSLFMLQSLNYVPFFNHYLFNLTNFVFLVFFILFIIKEMFFRQSISNISKILLAFFFVLLLVKFSRIAEYGSDIAGQILIAVYLFLVVEAIFNHNLNLNIKSNNLKLSLIFIVFAITTKFILVIYSIYLLLIFFLTKNKKLFLYDIFEIKYLLIILLPIIFLFFFNFTSTGCILYPLEMTCFSEAFSWSLPKDVVSYLNLHYEAWSKGGKGPNLELQNLDIYINSLNWIPHWISVYFFNKVSDYILVIFAIIIIFIIFFAKEIFSKKIFSFQDKKEFSLFFIFTILVLIIWFFNFPSLRYAGYIVVFIFLIFPFVYLISTKVDLKDKLTLKKISVIFLISYSVFILKNTNRIYNEINIPESEHHNFKNFPLYWVEDKKYQEIFINGHKIYITDHKCWDIPSTCVRAIGSLKISKYKNYIFYSKR